MEMVKFSDVRDKVVQLRNQDVLLDFSVAELYGEDMQTTDTETEIELNFAVLKLKYTVKRKK
jgi:hypothetical protein